MPTTINPFLSSVAYRVEAQEMALLPALALPAPIPRTGSYYCEDCEERYDLDDTCEHDLEYADEDSFEYDGGGQGESACGCTVCTGSSSTTVGELRTQLANICTCADTACRNMREEVEARIVEAIEAQPEQEQPQIKLRSYSGMSSVVQYNLDVLEYCRDSNNKALFGTTKMDGPKEITLGVELELILNDPDNTRAASLHDVHTSFLTKAEDGLYNRNCLTKSDGSIEGSGYEIVTIPATLNYHKQIWQGFFSNCTKYFSTNSSTGMHVHIGRKDFTPLSLSKFVIFINAVDNKAFINKIAGRIGGRYDAFRPAGWDAISTHGDNKYQSVNLGKAATIELRIFDSTTDEGKLFTRLEFTHALTSFVRQTSNKELSVMDFTKFVMRYPRQYPNLTKFIRGMLDVGDAAISTNMLVPMSRTSRKVKKYLDELDVGSDDIHCILDNLTKMAEIPIKRTGRLPKAVTLSLPNQIDQVLRYLTSPHRYRGKFTTWDGHLSGIVSEERLPYNILNSWNDGILRNVIPFDLYDRIQGTLHKQIGLHRNRTNGSDYYYDRESESYLFRKVKVYECLSKKDRDALVKDLTEAKELLLCA